jgi:hypothetical protein
MKRRSRYIPAPTEGGSVGDTLWYYEDSGRQAGPVSEAALRELIRTERLAREARVWRSGMAGWQPWPSVAALAAAAGLGAPAPAPAAPNPRDLELVELPMLVILSIVTLGVYGLVMFYRVGERYARLAPARRSSFETLFWIYVACYLLLFTGGVFFGPIVALAGLAAFVVGVLLLNEVLASRADVVRANGLRVALTSDTAHRVLWIVGTLTSWFAVGIVLLVIQGFKFFDDHNQIVLALRAVGPRTLDAGPIVATTPAGQTPIETTVATASAGEPLPAERACVRCGGPLTPADRFCSGCGAPAA